MPRLSHLRWHLVLAIGGALLIEWLHWHVATCLVAILAVDRVLTKVVQLVRHDGRRASPESRITTGPAERTRSRLPVALTRMLGADCPSCRGFGCESCAYSGLS